MLKTEERFRYRDLKAWPEEERWELIGGEPFVAPFDVLLRASADQAEDDVDTVLQPDLMVVCDPQKVQRNSVHGASTSSTG